MKKTLALTVALASTFASGAYAAPAAKHLKKKPAAKTAAKSAKTPLKTALVGTPAPSQQPGQAAPSASIGVGAPVPEAPAKVEAATTGGATHVSAAQAVAPAQDSVMSRLSSNYIGTYHGPAISNFNRFAPDEDKGIDTTMGGAQYMENSLRIGYKLNDDLALGGAFEGMWSVAGSQDFLVTDPFIRISDSNIWKKGDFALSGDFRYYAPINQTSRARDQIGQFRLNTTEAFTMGRWNFGGYTTLRRYAYATEGQVEIVNGKEVGVNRRTWRSYVGPFVNYQVTPKLALTGLYEAGGIQMEGDSLLHWNREFTDLEVGFNYDITSRISVNPYLNIFTGSSQVRLLSSDNISLGAVVSATFL